jgi:signal transduction histidine kinase
MMANRSRHLPSKIAAEPLVVALTAMLAIALSFVALGRDFGRVAHEAITTTLRSIDASHALLQRDVLRARAGLLSCYDPLVASVLALREAPLRLSARLREERLDADGYLDGPLDHLRAGIDSDEKLVEQFKTSNALLQNSLAVFGQTLTALNGSQDDLVRKALAEVGDLGNLMMQFAMTAERGLELAIRAQAEQLEQSEAIDRDPSLRTLLMHAGMVLEMLPAVDAAVAAISNSATRDQAERLQSRYLELVGKATSRNALSRLVLGGTAVSLWLCVLLVIVRLRKHTDYLEQRLTLENTLAAVKNRVETSPLAEFPQHMDAALAELAERFGARALHLALVEPGQRAIAQAFSSSGDLDTEAELVLDFAAALHLKASGAARSHSVKSWLPPRRCAARVWRPHPKPGRVVVGALLSGGRIGVLLLDIANPPRKLCSLGRALFQSGVAPLADLVDAHHVRIERNCLERRLQEAQRLEALGTLAGGIAHEFNNVLGSVLGYSEMALQLLRKPSASRRYVEKVLASGERAKRVVDQILAFSRKRERPSRPFDLVEAIADFQPLLHVTMADRVELRMTLPQQAAVIEGNPIELQQILINLCKNAMEASVRGQAVEVDVRAVEVARRKSLSHGEIAHGRHVRLTVRDYGAGIPVLTLPHIFEPFYTTRSGHGGTGLGLAAVHGLIAGMGGAIDVASAVGCGTTFAVYLPASGKVPVPIRSFYSERSTPLGRGQRVAILESDVFLLRMYEEKIAALGYEPVGCSDPGEMLTALASEELKPDIAMLDLSLIEGPDDRTRAWPATSDIPCILVADRERVWDLNRSRQGRASILGKPINSTALAKALFDGLNR